MANADPATETLEILISAMNLPELPNHFAKAAQADVRFLVINQCTEIEPSPTVERGCARMLSFAERGLSRSRNRALQNARSDLLLLSDDDVEYVPDVATWVRRAFTTHPDASIITFQYLNAETGRPVKPYPDAGFRHNRRSIGAVSSVEIALRRQLTSELRFDERFGLGTALPSGEEMVFLSDALRAGHRAYYFAQPVCLHPGHGSGHSHWTAQVARAKGAMLRRAYPLAWPAAIAYFAVTKHQLYSDYMGSVDFLREASLSALRMDKAT